MVFWVILVLLFLLLFTFAVEEKIERNKKK